MLIGEAPGGTEEQLGRPFVGATGQSINDCLKAAGLRRSKVYISNVVKCRPPGNRDPAKEELGACFTYLAEEIATVKPKVIVCVGRWALKAITSEDAISRARGKLLEPNAKVRVGGAKVIATYHPAAAMYNGSKRQTIIDSITEDLRYAQNLVRPTKVEATCRLLPEGYKSNELIEALRSIQSARELACDLEWIAPPGRKIAWPWTPNTELLSMSLTGRLRDGSYGTVAFSWPMPERARRALRAFLAARSLIFHNANADVIWMLSVGLDPIIGGDSMLFAYLLDEQRRAGLKGLAPLVAGVEAGWEQKPWHRRPRSREGWLELLAYNAGDTENTLRLHDALRTQCLKLPSERRQNIARVYLRLLLPAIKPFARMAYVGTPLKIKRLRRELDRQDRLMRRAIGRLSRLTGLRADAAERLASSPAQVTRYAREAFGLEIESSREDNLIDYVDQYPALAQIKEIKHRRKMISTYLQPWLSLADSQGDGRLHSVYLLGVTRTGRLSAEIEQGGSLLLTPRVDWMRDLIAAKDDDYEILAADYSQIELRIIAWLAPEMTMRRLYQQGADLHSTTAAYIKSKLPMTVFWKQRAALVRSVSKEERQRAKGIGFGFVFGLQEEHFAAYAKANYGVIFSPQEAHEAREGFFALYSDLVAWHERATRVDFERGYTLTPFGRYRFDLGDPTKAINTPIQSTASDLTVFALTIIDERFQAELEPGDAELIGFVHDCVLIHSRKSKCEIVKRIIQESMEHPPLERVGIGEIPVPLVAEVKAGATWARVG